MDYKVINSDDHTVIELSGKVDRGSVLTAASYMRELPIEFQQTIILDVDGLDDEREMFYHAAVINTIKKEIEFAGGTFRIRAEKESIRSYLSMTGLDRLFIFDKSAVISREDRISELQRC